MALRRGPSHGRGHASAGAVVLRNVRRVSAEPGWRAVAHRASVEVWIQEREGNRANKVYREPAGQYLEQSRAERVRFLLKRESECGPSALEPKDRKKAGRIFQTSDPDVQRI